VNQNISKIENIYDSVAKEYALKFADEHEYKPKDREMLLKFAQMLNDGKPVWDLGCGPGQTAAYLKNLGVEISGLDLSEKMIEQARIVHPDIYFMKGDILKLDFDDGSIAGAVSFYAIVHFKSEQVEQFIREVFRVLRQGGIFLLTFHIGDSLIHVDEFLGKKIDVDFLFFTTNFSAGGLKKCGFEDIEVIEREPYPEVEYQSSRAYVFAMKP